MAAGGQRSVRHARSCPEDRPDIPHDLATLVVERELGLPFGFWGCVAAGATIDTTGRRRTPQAVHSSGSNTDELDDAERLVNEVHFAWRRGVGTAHDAALGDVLDLWRALVDGDELVMDWDVPRQPSERCRVRGAQVPQKVR